MRIVTGTACVLATALWVPTASFAHDLPGLAGERASIDASAAKAFAKIDALEAIAAERIAKSPNVSGLEGVIETTLTWPDDVVTVCFMDGAEPAWDLVATIASDWTTSTRLTLDFGSPGGRRPCDLADPSDIRVSFLGEGSWSLVGTKASYIKPKFATLNLEGLGDVASLTNDDAGRVLHEFGHALGFQHEHQGTHAHCDDEFDWNYLYTALGWSKSEVDLNMRPLTKKAAKTLFQTIFDPKSVMLYSLPREAFVHPDKASCYIPEPNDVISALDRQTIQRLYPLAGDVAKAAPADFDPTLVATLTEIKAILAEAPKFR